MKILLRDIFSFNHLLNTVDVLSVGLLLYQIYRLAKGSATIKIVIGFTLLYLIYRLAVIIQLIWLTTLLGQVFYKSILVLVIIFQYEIRKLLASLGDFIPKNIRRLQIHLPWVEQKHNSMHVTSIVEAAKTLGGTNTGGLIVLTNTPDLKFYIESGDLINALVSKRLLLAILNKESPLHDGAVVIYKNTIIAARVILPVTERQDIPMQFALRHRAAIGMSEATDTLVLVISEVTGQLSIAYKGKLRTNLSTAELRNKINEYIRYY